MQNTRRGTRGGRIIDLLSVQQYLRFYEIMKYPIPRRTDLYFQYSDTQVKNKLEKINYTEEQDFSRDKKCEYMDEYIEEIKRLENTFKSIPFVEEIFLCNSMTFNALNKNSDIDIFIITQPGRIRSTKFRSMLLFTIKKAKRFGKHIRKKICLSFFITSNQQNLYSISLPSMDIYLSYRIAHLVLIYQRDENRQPIFFKQNQRVKGILPNFQEKQTISLGIKPFHGNTKLKNILEFLGNGFLGNIFEQFIKYIQKFIINIKILLNPIGNKDVITTDSMLKFHKDIREKISLKYNLKIKK